MEGASLCAEVAVDANADIESDFKTERNTVVDDQEVCELPTAQTKPPGKSKCYSRPVLIVFICITIPVAVALVVYMRGLQQWGAQSKSTIEASTMEDSNIVDEVRQRLADTRPAVHEMLRKQA